MLEKFRARLASSILSPKAWNYFYEGANISRNRSYQPIRAQDAKDTDIPWIRTVLLSHARRLYANVGFVRGVVRDLEMFATGPNGLTPKSRSVDHEWNDAADAWFLEWAKICDVSGRFTFRDLQKMALMLTVVDGDCGLILTETPNGYPKLQFIEAHQIGNSSTSVQAYPEQADSNNLQDGIWVDRKTGRPYRYRIISGEDSQEIDASAFVHFFEPSRATGPRGVSHFAPVLNHLRDIEDNVSYLKLQLKNDASLLGYRVALYGNGPNNQWDQALNAGNAATDVTLEQMMGGTLPTVRPGESYQFHSTTRPSHEAMTFIDYLESDCLLAVGLPCNWKLLHREGGATLRACLLRAQYRFQELQNLLSDKLCARIRNWAIAKANKRGELSPSKKMPVDWWRHSWQGPPLISADVTKVNKENREDVAFGLRTLQQDAAESGGDWEEIREDNEEAVTDLLIRAQRLAAKFNIKLDDAINLLSRRTPNPTPVDTIGDGGGQ